MLLVLPTQAQQGSLSGAVPESIKLGMARAEVWKHLGEPTEIHFLRVAGRKYTWDDWTSDSRDWMMISYRGRVVQTEYRIHVNAHTQTFTVFQRQHPHLRFRLYSLRDEVGTLMVADDVSRGVAWVLFIHYPQGFFPDASLAWDPMDVGPSRIIKHWPGRPALPPDIGDTPIKDARLMHDLRAWFALKASRG